MAESAREKFRQARLRSGPVSLPCLAGVPGVLPRFGCEGGEAFTPPGKKEATLIMTTPSP